MKLIDRTGERYGRLVVVERAPNAANAKDTNARWLCQCDCGRTSIAYGQDLKRGKVVSCGCWNEDRRTKHGMSRNHVYMVWQQLRDRCKNPNNPRWVDYGGRGIKVCERWDEFASFLADMGDRPKGYQLDRIDNNGNYEPGNCRWATPSQNLNNRRINRRLTMNGETLSIAEWAERVGINWYTIRSRLIYGWTIERALTEPVRSNDTSSRKE